MKLQRLARELEETARQTASLVDSVASVLDVLADPLLNADEARRRASAMIVTALQGQDRIEQRCHNLALLTRRIDLLPPDAAEALHDDIWASLALDELRGAAAPQADEFDAELF
jgi:hypothetical protein